MSNRRIEINVWIVAHFVHDCVEKCQSQRLFLQLLPLSLNNFVSTTPIITKSYFTIHDAQLYKKKPTLLFQQFNSDDYYINGKAIKISGRYEFRMFLVDMAYVELLCSIPLSSINTCSKLHGTPFYICYLLTMWSCLWIEFCCIYKIGCLILKRFKITNYIFAILYNITI